MSNFVRRVVRVKTPSHGAELYVRAITGAEFMDLGSRMNKVEGATASTAIQLEAYVCNADGSAYITAGGGLAFMEQIEAADMRRLMKEGDKLNALNDEAVEEEIKN